MTKSFHQYADNASKHEVQNHSQHQGHVTIHKRSPRKHHSGQFSGAGHVNHEAHSRHLSPPRDRQRRRSHSPGRSLGAPKPVEDYLQEPEVPSANESEEQVLRLQQALNQLNSPNFEEKHRNEESMKDAVDGFSLVLADEDW